jgi:predicted PurR-regulated permease PerM
MAPAPPNAATAPPAPSPGLLDTAADRAWKLLVIGLAGLAIVYLLVELRVAVLPVIAALLISTLIAPPVRWLEARGWPRVLALWTVILGSLAILVGLVATLAPQVTDQVGEVGTSVKEGSTQVINYLARSPFNLSRADVDRYVDSASQEIRANSGLITSGVLAGAVKVGEVIVGLLLTFVLAFFFVKDGEGMYAWFARQFPTRRRASVHELGLKVWATLGAYVRGIALVGLVDAVLIAIALLLIDVPLVIPLALLTFFGSFLPLIGATVAGTVAALVALVSGGLIDAVLVGVAILVIQQVEGHVLQPLVLGRAVKLHPVVVILALTAGAILGGIAGAFLAVPVTAVTTVVGSHLKHHHGGAPVGPE